MKKIIFLSLFTSALYSQTIYTADGTLTANRTVTMNGKNLTIKPINANTQFFINGTNGNVGVGTITPTTKLDVNGDIKAKSGVFTNSLLSSQNFITNDARILGSTVLSAGTLLDVNSGARLFTFMDMPVSNFQAEPWSWFSIDDRNYTTRLRMIGKTGSGTEFELFNKSQEEIFRVIEDGNDKTTVTLPKVDSYLGIGTNSFIDGSDIYKLSVKGAIRAHEVKVYTAWADYVFKEDYKLPSLKEVEDHIKLNGHLINVPSAEQVEKEGIKIGEMAKIQQEKIEELTLYIIQQNKDIEELKNQVKTLIEKNK